jgi:hypothetical protein
LTDSCKTMAWKLCNDDGCATILLENYALMDGRATMTWKLSNDGWLCNYCLKTVQ